MLHRTRALCAPAADDPTGGTVAVTAAARAFASVGRTVPEGDLLPLLDLHSPLYTFTEYGRVHICLTIPPARLDIRERYQSCSQRDIALTTFEFYPMDPVFRRSKAKTINDAVLKMIPST
ncbi:hypothetical protein Trydic_g87 [Trypoxylus dichotomus]